MKIQELFEKYKTLINSYENIDDIFANSYMLNEFCKNDLYRSFFPLGSGVFTEKTDVREAELQYCRVLVLGNDWGTKEDLDKRLARDKTDIPYNATIANLQKLGLDIETTFFTNFYMGVREKGTATKRFKKVDADYEDFCFEFFKIQLAFMKPKIVLCLGGDVGEILAKKSLQFVRFKEQVTKLYTTENNNAYIVNADKEFGSVKFVLIPHPSYPLNWRKNDIENKIREVIK